MVALILALATLILSVVTCAAIVEDVCGCEVFLNRGDFCEYYVYYGACDCDCKCCDNCCRCCKRAKTRLDPYPQYDPVIQRV